MFRKTQRSPWEQFLSEHRALATFLSRVRVESAGLSHLETCEDFAAELKTLPAPARPTFKLDQDGARRMAIICRAAEVALGKTPWDHQIVCAALLLQGLIIELPNGSGKTIAAFLAAGFNATSGYHTHVVTANDYLAERDLRQLGPAYHLIGADVGIGYSRQTADLLWGVWDPAGACLRATAVYDSPLAVQAAAERIVTTAASAQTDMAAQATEIVPNGVTQSPNEQAVESPKPSSSIAAAATSTDGAPGVPPVTNGGRAETPEIPKQPLVNANDGDGPGEDAKKDQLAQAGAAAAADDEDKSSEAIEAEPELGDHGAEVPAELQHQPLAALRIDQKLTEQDVLGRSVVYGRIEFFAFAFLKDSRKMSVSEQALTKRDLLIVDECDTVLLDDLRVPIILTDTSSQTPEPSLDPHVLLRCQALASRLLPGVDFVVDGYRVDFTFPGVRRIGELVGFDIFAPPGAGLALALRNTLRAIFCHRSGVDYLTENGRVTLVEKSSGRLLIGRRYTEGLHEAIEIKEGLPVTEQTARQQSVGRITIKHFTRLYDTVSGMSGTVGPVDEYQRFYGLSCVPIQLEAQTRFDRDDVILRTSEEALRAAVRDALQEAAQGRAVLLNVPTIRQVDAIMAALNTLTSGSEIPPFQVLDGRTVSSLGVEAEMVARAGQAGFITVCTKVAARGTDIWLDDKAIQNGGLHVIGVERASDRRYDDQLRGRAGRHGQPGSSVFVVSLEDEIMFRFGGAQMTGWYRRFMDEDQPLGGAFLSSRIRAVQKALQAQALARRVSVVEFDDVVARHRLVFYSLRQRLLVQEQLREDLSVIIDNWVEFLRRNLLPSARSVFGAPRKNRAFLGKLADAFDDNEADLILGTRERKEQAEVLRRILSAKVERVLRKVIPEPGFADEAIRIILLNVLDSEWENYHRFEDDALDEVHLYSSDDPAAFERYARKMEDKFDSFFFDVGESVLAYLLFLRRTE